MTASAATPLFVLKPGPWTTEFDEHGGYDCMYGAWVIKDANGQTVVIVDQQEFGQRSCDYNFRSAEAEQLAKIVAGLGALK